ncbi:exportin-4-like isoform X2 [Lineus longissimus]
MVKRGTLDTKHTDRQALYKDLTDLIGSGDITMQMIACSVMTALLNEYSTTSRSSSIGLPWEFHNKCKKAFQEYELKKMFAYMMPVLGQLVNYNGPMNPEITLMFHKFLALSEQVLSWEFVQNFIPRRQIGSFGCAQFVTLKPTPVWREVLLDPQVLDVFFKLHQKVHHIEDLGHFSLRCLSQLASMNGRIFPDNDAQTKYLVAYLERFLQLFTTIEIQEYEAYSLSNTINSLVILFPPACFKQVPDTLFKSFLDQMKKMTCQFCQAAALEETMHKDDKPYTEAYEKLLDSWAALLADPEFIPPGTLHEQAVEIINSYLQCHLGPPNGLRGQTPEGQATADDEEYMEEDEEDRIRFKDQLTTIGMLCRHVADYSIPLLAQVVEERVSKLQDFLAQFQQNMDLSNLNELHNLYEDLHWLFLISACALTEDREGEVPMIPPEIIKLSLSQANEVNLNSTMQVLGSPSQKLKNVVNEEKSVDSTIRLIAAVFRYCEMEKQALAANFTSILSPQVASSTMWFLGRWVKSYLVPNEKYYKEVSMALCTAFGRDTDGAKWTVTFLLQKIVSTLLNWGTEPCVSKDTAELLVILLENRDRANFVVWCDELMKLAELHSKSQLPVSELPPDVKKLLSRALVMATSKSMTSDEKLREFYKEQVLDGMYRRFQAILKREDLSRVYQEIKVKAEVQDILHCCCGIAEATSVKNFQQIFDFLHPVLVEAVNVYGLYHNHEDMVQLILEMFVDVANTQLCYLDHSGCQKLYDTSFTLIQSYAKHNVGKRFIKEDEEEEQLVDLVLVLDLLINIISKDFLNINILEDSASDDNDSSMTVFYGLNLVMPLISEQMLQFPNLCSQYYKLVSYIAEIYPEKICELPEGLYNFLMSSVQKGLTLHGPDITQLCLEFLYNLAIHINRVDMIGTSVHVALGHFLQGLLNFIVMDSFDMDLMEITSNTFFALVCCHQERYHALVNELLQTQTDKHTQERLVAAFNKLTPPDFKWNFHRSARIAFLQNFEEFLIGVRGFLCVR